MQKLLILGMGNKFFGDDGVGIIITEKLNEIFKNENNIDIEETNWGGFRIIDLLTGYNKAIIIDALTTGKKPTGFIHKFNYDEIIHSVRMISFHDINFATAVEFAKILDIPMPDEITVYGIEVEKIEHFSENLSQEMWEAVDNCVQLVKKEITENFTQKVEESEIV